MTMISHVLPVMILLVLSLFFLPTLTQRGKEGPEIPFESCGSTHWLSEVIDLDPVWNKGMASFNVTGVLGAKLATIEADLTVKISGITVHRGKHDLCQYIKCPTPFRLYMLPFAQIFSTPLYLTTHRVRVNITSGVNLLSCIEFKFLPGLPPSVIA